MLERCFMLELFLFFHFHSTALKSTVGFVWDHIIHFIMVEKWVHSVKMLSFDVLSSASLSETNWYIFIYFRCSLKHEFLLTWHTGIVRLSQWVQDSASHNIITHNSCFPHHYSSQPIVTTKSLQAWITAY